MKTTEQFINEANQVHNGEYDYSKLVYTGNKNKVEIICKKHGSFFPLAGNHLVGHKCKKCSVETSAVKMSSTQEEVIAAFNKKHGEGTYDYSKVVYTGNKKDVIIICPKHGEFTQKPIVHIRKQSVGCPVCSGNTKARNTEEFIEVCNTLHNNKYDYSLVKFKDCKHKVTIICPTHGKFKQIPTAHLQGHGCVKCGKLARKYELEQHLDLWRKLHYNKYDYSLITEVKRDGYVEIICPKHGKFTQRVKCHAGGSGCQKCICSHGENKIKDYLDKNNIKYAYQHKFEDCRGIRNRLPFDFYLPDYNMCVEYQGQGHYFQIMGWGGGESFKKIKRTDRIKKKYCLKNNIKLLEIKYDIKDPVDYLASILLRT